MKIDFDKFIHLYYNTATVDISLMDKLILYM